MNISFAVALQYGGHLQEIREENNFPNIFKERIIKMLFTLYEIEVKSWNLTNIFQLEIRRKNKMKTYDFNV